jgi:hypothetical protein
MAQNYGVSAKTHERPSFCRWRALLIAGIASRLTKLAVLPAMRTASFLWRHTMGEKPPERAGETSQI